MNLAIDIGNSSAKLGRFSEGRLVREVITVEHDQLAQTIRELDTIPFSNIVVSSVSESMVGNLGIPPIRMTVLTKDLPIPFELDYETPKTLGVDRLAAAAGAQQLNPKSTSMIIDMGSCITYDILENGWIFRGGVISPGARLRFLSMNQNTSALPLISMKELKEVEWPDLLGKSTFKAMVSGVVNGINFEVETFIKKYQQHFPEMRVFLTGGEAEYFESKLKAPIFAVPSLVLVGLNRILEYNAQESK